MMRTVMDRFGTRWTVTEYGRRSVGAGADRDPPPVYIHVTYLFAGTDGRRIYRDGILGDLERLTDAELLALPEHDDETVDSSGT